MKKFIILFIICFFIFLSFYLNSVKEDDVLIKIPNKVVFILVDTLRADHLPFYGYKHNTTPFLNTLSNNAVLFKNMYSTSSYTAPATASLFTSLYAKEHGVTNGMIYSKKEKIIDVKLNKIPNEALTLPELFKQAGYNTFGVSDNLNISKEMGFSQGFDKLITKRYVGAYKINSLVLSLEKEIKNSEKYFLYIHYMDPHSPYHLQKTWARKGKEKKMIKAYDSEISYVDDAIKRLYKIFDWEEDTLIIFTADHGEAFGERKNSRGKFEFGHGKTLNREVLRVPLFFYKNGLRQLTLNSYVSHLDILPTLSELLGIEKKAYWNGDQLTTMLLGKDNLHSRYLFSDLEGKYDRSKISSVIFENYHYVKNFGNENEAESEGFFDWNKDPMELNKNSASNLEILKELKEKVSNHVKLKPIFKEEKFDMKLDKKTLNHLSTLGYIN